MRYVPQFLANQHAEILQRNIDYFERMTKKPGVTPTQVRLYWRIIRQMREDLANQRGL